MKGKNGDHSPFFYAIFSLGSVFEKKVAMENISGLFCTLARIPSPSMKEDAVLEKIKEILTGWNISHRQDACGNIYASIPATDEGKQPLALSAHTDVVGDFSPVNLVFSDDGKTVGTDKTRTLGADDKAGVAAAMWLAKELAEDKTLKHGGLEIILTRDEERGMTGASSLEFDQIKSEYVLVLDSDRLGDLPVAGASYTKLFVSVHSVKSGHSGLDIGDETRVNAAKLIADLVSALPNGVYKADETGVVTSLNIGAIAAGGIQNASSDLQGADYLRFLTQNAMSNVINADAFALYSIRSSEVDTEEKLKRDILKIVEGFNEKYAGLATICADFETHLLPFERSEDTTVIDVVTEAAEKQGIEVNISSFHAGAETHIYAHKRNAAGKKFKPYLFGIADVYNMHSPEEHMDLPSLHKGSALLKEVFLTFNRR